MDLFRVAGFSQGCYKVLSRAGKGGSTAIPKNFRGAKDL